MKANKTRQQASNGWVVLCTCSACTATPDIGLQGRMIPAWKRLKHGKSDKMTPSLFAATGKVKRTNPFRVQVATQASSSSTLAYQGQLSVPAAVTSDNYLPDPLERRISPESSCRSQAAVDTHKVQLEGWLSVQVNTLEADNNYRLGWRYFRIDGH
ncbi:hypothetical protein K439DRAFT_1616911 [Ramaria rubella]|nr:hypothetical protein K439DRAFT_1616911 [Ramaria rubella]